MSGFDQSLQQAKDNIRLKNKIRFIIISKSLKPTMLLGVSVSSDVNGRVGSISVQYLSRRAETVRPCSARRARGEK